MNVVNFILAHWDSVIAVLVLAAGVLFLYKRGETQILDRILFGLVTKAEREYGGGTGELKKAAVIEWAYDKIPVVLKLLITRRGLERMIDNVLAYAKTKWAANPSLRGYIDAAPSEADK